MNRIIFTILFSVLSIHACADWMDLAVESEFSGFQDGISIKHLEKTWKKVSKNDHYKRYQVIQSKVYGPQSSIRDLLEIMVTKYRVPDVDFIYYHQDIVRSEDFKHKPGPILVSAKARGEPHGVLFIDWYYFIKKRQSGWNALIDEIQQNRDRFAWSEKFPRLLWRGRETDGNYTATNWHTFPRGKAVYQSMTQFPDLIDARFINAGEQEQPLLNQLTASFMSPSEQMQYKYLLDIDGVTCTYPSLAWKLLTGCLVFKQTTNDMMWYYHDLVPWKHYIPVQQDLSDLAEKIMWAIAHDSEAKQIADQGRQFAETHLMSDDILLYCYKVLQKYASLQHFKPAQ